MKAKQIIKNIISKQDIENTILNIWKYIDCGFNPDYHTYEEWYGFDYEEYRNSDYLFLTCVKEWILEYCLNKEENPWRSDRDIDHIYEELIVDKETIDIAISELVKENKLIKNGNLIENTSTEQKRQKLMDKIKNADDSKIEKWIERIGNE